MGDAIAHRGPDDGGSWTDPDAGIAFAHRRLSIVDLSPAGHQPMHSVDGRWVLAYNGEIYNHLVLRAALESEGRAPAWRGHSDTETLLACICAWGLEHALRQSRGMFALAAWDRERRELWLARDRVGEKPLYYGWQGRTFLFGSELKALRAHPDFIGGVDRGALALFLRHNYVPEPNSIHPGIHKLAPGCSLRVSLETRESEPVPYWSLSNIAEQAADEPFAGSENDAVDDLERLLGDAVRGQMVADVPLGALLSGGIDSTLVTALMQAASGAPVRTFTIGFRERAHDESDHARAVAAHLGTQHTELVLSGDDALALIPSLPTIYDEPFADSSQLPTHLVMRLARAHVTVALSGDGGDEMFGGYNRYMFAPRLWKRLGVIPRQLRRLIGRTLTAIPPHVVDRLAAGPARFAGVVHAGEKAHKLGRNLVDARSVDDLYRGLVSAWPNASAMVLNSAFPANVIDDRARWPRLADPAARMMALDALTYLPGDILAKVDRASMAVSLETRAPFLDHRVIEFAWRLPMELKIRNGTGKWILRRLLDRYIPASLLERPKQGFAIPLDAWLRGPLRDWAESLLSEQRLRREGFFDPKKIREAWRQHVSGQASFGSRLWSVLMFQAWLESQADAR